ncbi:MAG: cache domain-containing protein [Elusimicrobiales bacterium]
MGTILYNRIDVSLKVAENAVVSMSGAPWIAGALTDGAPDSVARGESVLARYCGSFNLSVCYLVNKKGVVTASTNRRAPDSFIGKNYSFRPYFYDAMAGRSGLYLGLGVTSGERGYYASYPVRDQGGRIAGAAVIKKNMSGLAEDMRRFPYAFLVSPEGIMFVQSRGDLLFRSMWPMVPKARARLASSKQFGPLNFTPLLVSEARDGQTLTFEGYDFYVSRHQIGPPGWSLVTFASMRPVKLARFGGVLISLVACLLILSFLVVLVHTETARETAEKMLQLREEVRTLSGIVPICAGCKKIRDDKGYWERVEVYVAQHTHAEFSHGLCPDCMKRLYPQYAEDNPAPGTDSAGGTDKK